MTIPNNDYNVRIIRRDLSLFEDSRRHQGTITFRSVDRSGRPAAKTAAPLPSQGPSLIWTYGTNNELTTMKTPPLTDRLDSTVYDLPKKFDSALNHQRQLGPSTKEISRAPPPPPLYPLYQSKPIIAINTDDHDSRSYEQQSVRPAYEQQSVRPAYEQQSVRPAYEQQSVRPAYKRHVSYAWRVVPTASGHKPDEMSSSLLQSNGYISHRTIPAGGPAGSSKVSRCPFPMSNTMEFVPMAGSVRENNPRRLRPPCSTPIRDVSHYRGPSSVRYSCTSVDRSNQAGIKQGSGTKINRSRVNMSSTYSVKGGGDLRMEVERENENRAKEKMPSNESIQTSTTAGSANDSQSLLFTSDGEFISSDMLGTNASDKESQRRISHGASYDGMNPISAPKSLSSYVAPTRHISRDHGHNSNNTPSTGRRLKRRIAGLRNFGNTCYCNAVIQGLLSCQDFCSKWVSVDSFGYVIKRRHSHPLSPFKGLLMKAWTDLLSHIFTQEKGKYSSSDMIKSRQDHALKRLIGVVMDHNKQFSMDVQGDAHEFLQVLIAGLSAEANEASIKGHVTLADEDRGLPMKKFSDLSWLNHLMSSRSEIELMFRSQFISEIKCLECSRFRYRSEPEFDWGLELGENDLSGGETTLLELLRLTTEKVESLLLRCDGCNKNTNSTLRRFPIRLPTQYLCIQIKRFAYDWKRRTTYRLNTSVHIPPVVDFGSFLITGEPAIFELTGMTLQTGSLQMGHYSGIHRLPSSTLWNNPDGISSNNTTTTTAAEFSFIDSASTYYFSDEVVETGRLIPLKGRSSYLLWFERKKNGRGDLSSFSS